MPTWHVPHLTQCLASTRCFTYAHVFIVHVHTVECRVHTMSSYRGLLKRQHPQGYRQLCMIHIHTYIWAILRRNKENKIVIREKEESRTYSVPRSVDSPYGCTRDKRLEKARTATHLPSPMRWSNHFKHLLRNPFLPRSHRTSHIAHSILRSLPFILWWRRALHARWLKLLQDLLPPPSFHEPPRPRNMRI